MRGWQSARSKAKAPGTTCAEVAWSDALVSAPSWPPKAPDEAEIEAAFEATFTPEPSASSDAETAAETAMIAPLALQSEVLRLLEVVTTMCDHVIEYVEADRAERRLMIETLVQLGRVVTERAQAPIQPPAELPLESPLEERERVIGGSMPAGPEPVVDLRAAERETEPELEPEPLLKTSDPTPTTMEIAVEVRGRYGDRWVGGFEICEVMTTPDGPRYRLRRHRDGAVLPELFDATSIRHIETFDQLSDQQLNDSSGYWSRS